MCSVGTITTHFVHINGLINKSVRQESLCSVPTDIICTNSNTNSTASLSGKDLHTQHGVEKALVPEPPIHLKWKGSRGIDTVDPAAKIIRSYLDTP